MTIKNPTAIFIILIGLCIGVATTFAMGIMLVAGTEKVDQNTGGAILMFILGIITLVSLTSFYINLIIKPEKEWLDE